MKVFIELENTDELKRLLRMAANQSEQLKDTLNRINEFRISVNTASMFNINEIAENGRPPLTRSERAFIIASEQIKYESLVP